MSFRRSACHCLIATRFFAGVVTLGVVFCSFGSSLAQDGNAPGSTGQETMPKRNWLRAVVVTASRGEEELLESPYMAERVELADFSQKRLARTVPEALDEVPGVMVQKTAHGHGSPYIRGFTSFRTLLLVDGVRINNSIFRPGPNQYWNTVDPYAIDRLEVVKGPASVLYGSDAIGGAVNAVTRRWTDYGEGFQGGGRLLYRFATAERSHVGRFEAGGSWDRRLGILVGGTIKRYGDVDGGRFVGPMDETGYCEYTGDIKVLYRFDEDTLLTFAFYDLTQNDVWRTHKTLHGFSWEGTTVGDERQRSFDQDHTLSYLRYHKKNIGGFLDEMTLTGSWQYMGEQQFRIRNDFRRDIQGFDVHTLGLAAQFVSPSPIGKWTYGVEWYRDWVSSFKRSYAADGSFAGADIQGPVGDDATYDLLGIYVQNEIPLAERLDLILGGRYTFARASADTVKDPDGSGQISVRDEWDAFVGSARLRWFVDPEERVCLFGGVSQGFRAPNLSDLTRNDSARTNEFEIVAPGLDPERYINYEAGIKGDFDDVKAQAAYFYMTIDDRIVRTPTGTVNAVGERQVTKQNAGDGYVHGVELKASYRFHPQFTVFGDVAWMYGEVDTYPTSAPVKRREPLSRLMPTTGHLGLRWDHPEGHLWAEALVTAACRADELNSRDRGDTQRIPPDGTPSYTVIDLRGGWKVNKNVNVWAGVENLTNRDYRIHGSGVNQPGINMKLGVEVNF
ncbi:MAG: TonB-dependent receptor [Phycisphaerae bacterium]